MRRVMSFVIAAALVAVPLTVLAGGKGRGKGPGMGRPMMKQMLKEKVGLSDEQIDRIQKLHYEADKAKLDVHYEIQKARLDLRQLLDADKPNKTKIFAQIDKIGALEIKMKKNRMGLMLEIRDLVTPEQWQKMEMLHAKRKMMQGKRGGPHGHHGGMGPMGGPDGPGPDGPGPDGPGL